jgi:hypothetical protein
MATKKARYPKNSFTNSVETIALKDTLILATSKPPRYIVVTPTGGKMGNMVRISQ